MNLIAKTFVTLLIERPAGKKSYAEMIEKMGREGLKIRQRIAASPDTDKNRAQLSHIIGIECWAQRRLQVALGAPHVRDEYDGYRPKRDTSWDDLRTQFDRTRAESIAIAKLFIEEDVPVEKTVLHNQMGNVSTRGWLQYITFHASQEAKRIKMK